MLSNSVGVIDSGYRGEVMAKFKRVTGEFDSYQVGDRIAQLIIIPYPEVVFVEADELTDSDRGVGGYGSTGK
jgi:dUTP pyrophosphatase